MAAAQADAWRYQDGVVLVAPFPGAKPRAQWYWDRRAPAEWKGYNVRAAWEEAEIVDARVGKGGVARLHEPSGMVLVVSWGILLHASRREYYRELVDESPNGYRDMEFTDQ